jgi:tRNA(fMet)-specific endonuclease VapC
MLDFYGRLRAELSRKGRPIGPLDTLIAAHALSLGVTLITSNIKEFRRVRGLRVEDWARA